MKKLVIMFVFCLFSLINYSQVITVQNRSIKYEVENYDSTTLKLDSIKAIITSNPNINYVNFFESNAFRTSIESKDIIKMDENTVVTKIKKKRPKYFCKSKHTPKPRPRYIIPSRTTSYYYRDYRTGYTVETHIGSSSGYAVMKDAKGKIISTTRMSW